jgi:Zn-dependent protease with chaperone function
VGLALGGLVGISGSARAGYDPQEFEKRATAELAAQAPSAVSVWSEANEARGRGDFARASELYARVRQLAPRFVHALRRQCGAEAQLNHRSQALALCRQALARERSPENLAALALVLAGINEDTKPTAAERAQAVSLAKQATEQLPDDFVVQATLCEVAIPAQDMAALKRCSQAVARIAPDQPAGPIFQFVVALSEQRFADARGLLDRARALGAPADQLARLTAILERDTPPPSLVDRYGPLALRLGIGWVGTLLALVMAGFLLSGLTLRASRRLPREASGRATGLDAGLRKLYGGVLWLSCAYYYLSIPLVLVAVLAAGGGLIYAFFALGRIPVKLVLLIVVGVIVTIWAIIKSLFVRVRDDDPGTRLELARQPRLRALLDEVAARVGTRAVDNVYLTPGTDVAVMERGGMLRQLAGNRERCLILGAGVLDGFEVGSFKAVLAHEYGHFSNQDTAGGGLALAVRRSLAKMAFSLARGGAATWYNPAWWFVSGFYRIFLRISQGASRLQEALADRWAAFSYGSEPFERGLRHVIERSVRFDAHINSTLNEVVQAKRALGNLYRYRPESPPDDTEVARAVEEALQSPPSPYDSHPAPSDRIAWVRALAASPAVSSMDDRAEVWALLSDRDEIERLMTSRVRQGVLNNHGIMIPDAGSSSAPQQASG